MKSLRIISVILPVLVAGTATSYAQIYQTIRGTVKDADTKIALGIATVATYRNVGQMNVIAFDSTFLHLKNSIYLELFGNAITPSINYERLFYKKDKAAYSLRIGITPIHPKGELDSVEIVPTLFIPITGSLFIGKSNSLVELGAGCDIAPLPDDQFALPHPEIIGVLIAGYRYMPANKKILLRISYTPFFGRLGPNWGHIKNSKGNGIYYHFAGVSIGNRF